jgi:hypothetical protein
LRLAVVAVVAAEVAVVVAVADTASPAVALLQVVLSGARDRRPVNVVATAAACRITAVLIVEIGRIIAVTTVATCKIIAATAVMISMTIARKTVRIGRITRMMCAMTAVTGMMIVTVDGSV